MIKIEKQNEIYQISEVTDNGWTMTGTAENRTDKSCSINLSISKPGELMESIGSYNYYSPVENEMISINYNVTEANKDEFLTYVDTVVDTVLAKFRE